MLAVCGTESDLLFSVQKVLHRYSMKVWARPEDHYWKCFIDVRKLFYHSSCAFEMCQVSISQAKSNILICAWMHFCKWKIKPVLRMILTERMNLPSVCLLAPFEHLSLCKLLLYAFNLSYWPWGEECMLSVPETGSSGILSDWFMVWRTFGIVSRDALSLSAFPFCLQPLLTQ